MRKILAALVAAGAMGLVGAMPASADVVIQTPGFTVEVDVSAAAGSQSAGCSTSFTPVS